MNMLTGMAQRGWRGGERIGLALLLAVGCFALTAGPLMAAPEVSTLEADDVTASGVLLRGELTSLGSATEVDAFFRWRELDFDGVSLSGTGGSGVAIGSNIGGLSSSDVSVSMWIKPDNWSTVQQFFFLGGVSHALECLFNPSIGGKAVIRVFWYTASIQINLTVDTAYLPPLNEWSHIAVVYKRGSPNDSLSFYVNGDHIVTATHGAANYSTDGSAAFLANHSNASLNRNFKGGMSDVRIYTSALSATDVENLHAGQHVTGNLVARWKLDDGYGTTAADSSGNGYHGSVTGGTWISPAWTATTANTLTETGVFDEPLAGLNGVTDYHYQAVAQWDGGASEVRGENVRFTTPSGDPVVETGPPSAVTGESATLSGTLTYAGASTPTAVSVHWGLTDGGTLTGAWDDTHEIEENAAEGPYTHAVTDLVTNRVYFYRFSATDDDALTVWGEGESFLTGLVGIEGVSDANEHNLQPGSFRLVRHADATNGAVTVFYTIDGGSTATLDVNYEAPTWYDTISGTGTVVMAEGEAEATITVTPILDTDNANDTELTLNLVSDVRYLIDSASDSASITIAALSYPGAPTNTWIGSGNASDAANWSLGVVPTSGHDILLGAFSTDNMTWNAGEDTGDGVLTDTVASWTQAAGYTGTVTFGTTYAAYSSTFTTFTVTGNGTVDGGVWTHLGDGGQNVADGSEQYRLRVHVGGNLTIGAAGSINLIGRGFFRRRGYGGTDASRASASHGGFGTGNTPIYGSITEPVLLGSGGDGNGNQASHGGGAVYLTVGGETTLVAATSVIDAAGNRINYGAGSGGSIYLRTGSLSGSGRISADGGRSDTLEYTASGAGGRVAVVLTAALADFSSFAGDIRARTGSYGPYSAAGTVYLQTGAQYNASETGSLIVDNKGYSAGTRRSTLAPAGVDLAAFSEIIITNMACLSIDASHPLVWADMNLSTAGSSASFFTVRAADQVTWPQTLTVTNMSLVLDSPVATLENVVVENGGVLTHSGNGSTQAHKLDLTLSGALTVKSGGHINVVGRGFSRNRGPGSPDNTGNVRDYIGGSYGGIGGDSTGDYVPGPTYGSIVAPTHIGSGGGGNNDGGAGGGAVILDVAGTTTVQSGGSINADANTSSFNNGGSGGSVYLRTQSLSGAGEIRANGGPSGSPRVSGGGGRVVVILRGNGETFDAFTGAGGVISAFGNQNSASAGKSAPGTVYLQTGGEYATGRDVGIIQIRSAISEPRYTHLPPSYVVGDPDYAFTDDLSRVSLKVSTHGRAILTGTLTAAGLDIDGANARLDLNGHTFHLRSLVIDGVPIGAGTYSAAELPAQVIDSADPAIGQIVLPASGSLFLMR